MSESRVLVFGGGVPALATAAGLARRGVAVDLVGPTEPARYPALPEGGIQLGSVPMELARAIAGDVEPPAAVSSLAQDAAGIVERLVTEGVAFARDGEGLARRRLPGCEDADAAYVSASTASAIAWALDIELERLVTDGADLRRLPDRELVDLVTDDGAVVGLLVFDRVARSLEGLTGSPVVLATTGAAGSLVGVGARCFPELAVSAAYRAGAYLAGSGHPRLHPTLLAHGRMPQPLSSSLRAEGARIWVPKDEEDVRIPRDIPPSDREYFAEDRFGKEALPDDERLAKLVREVTERRGVFDRQSHESRGTAYLDISHLPEGHLRPRLGEELDAIAQRAPRHPCRGPFEIRAGAVELGCGLWVDEGELAQKTSLPGLWAVGSSAWSPWSTSPLDGLTLLGELHQAERAAEAIAESLDTVPATSDDVVEEAQSSLEETLVDDVSTSSIDEMADLLADALDDLAFELATASEVREHITSLAADLPIDERSIAASQRAVVESVELGLAACAMTEAAPSEDSPRWRRGEDGSPEEVTP
jgi:succinate dehydrogenase / fumarate reductase flavoprotein subunit